MVTPKKLQADYGAQAGLQTARRPHLYLLDPARRTRIAQVFQALRGARGHHIADWLKSWRGNRNPFQEGMPWLSWPCIDYLNQHLCSGMRVFEYGGGGSTLYFLSKDCQVTTVEGHPGWGQALQERARSLVVGDRFQIRVINTQDRDPAAAAAYVNSVRDGAPWDLILIDGGFRLECFAEAIHHLAHNGFVVFDNTDLIEYSQAYRLAESLERSVFPGLGFGRRSPTTTEIFRVPGKTSQGAACPEC